MFASSASTASMHAVRRRDREAASDYVSRHPTETVLYALVRDHLESFLDHARQKGSEWEVLGAPTRDEASGDRGDHLEQRKPLTADLSA